MNHSKMDHFQMDHGGHDMNEISHQDHEKAKKIFTAVKPQYHGMQIEEIDATTPKGMELVQKYGIMASPGIIINNELFSTGALSKEDFIKKLNELNTS